MNDSLRKRIELTVSCSDCDYIPKHESAGIISDDIQVMHNGIKIVKGCYHGDWMSEIINRLKGHHEPQEEKAFYEVLGRLNGSRTMIELGSNWAYYSMWFNSSHPEAFNIMVEPNSNKLAAGINNFKLNNMTGTFENAFISNEVKDQAKFKDWDGRLDTINQVSVDDLIERHNLKKVDIVHSDIQGAEYKMLLGCEKSVGEGKIDYFFISTHSLGIHSDCIEWLVKKKFNILCNHTPEQSYSVDGLIVASRHDEEVIKISKRFCS